MIHYKLNVNLRKSVLTKKKKREGLLFSNFIILEQSIHDACNFGLLTRASSELAFSILHTIKVPFIFLFQY